MDISIVIPLYNEEESLGKLYGWIEKVMKENKFSYEVIAHGMKLKSLLQNHPMCMV